MCVCVLCIVLYVRKVNDAGSGCLIITIYYNRPGDLADTQTTYFLMCNLVFPLIFMELWARNGALP